MDELQDHVGGSEIDIMPYTNVCCLETMGCKFLIHLRRKKEILKKKIILVATILGLDINLKSKKGEEFIESLSE